MRRVCFIDERDGQVATCICGDSRIIFSDEPTFCPDCPHNPFPNGIIPEDRVLRRKQIIGVCKYCWMELYENELILKSSHKMEFPYGGDDLFCLDCAEQFQIEGTVIRLPYTARSKNG